MKKVTAKNLMIGDWVKWRNNYMQVWQVTQYLGDSAEIALCTNLKSNIKEVITLSATPIPITEDWLRLNGWVVKLNAYGHEYQNDSKNRILYHIDDKTFSFRGGLIENIQYIHQLQQAYRLATGGKELKLTF